MNFKMGLLFVLVFAALAFSGCLGTEDVGGEGEGSLAVINKTLINDETIVGSWVQPSTGCKLVFLSDHTFVRIFNNSYYNGTWRIENSNMLILTMETWDFSENISGEYLGEDDVSFGTVSNNVLTFTSINEDFDSGFPSGEFLPEGVSNQSVSSGTIAAINDGMIVGTWDHQGSNCELVFSSNHTFVQTVNGQSHDGTWRIEYDNLLILNMKTYDRRNNYLGKEDVSYGSLKDGVLTFDSINDSFAIGFPAGDFVKV
ncbi:hypothetical protein MmiEs2_10660 [Methanimicrococcus stummii]|uniref:Lipocalin-like domain-containing protein n=1 Tax=Methanimicrococcus stummii TaxID=3028294 RepID=A0AA96V9V9_9EURY|nr:hypothetical protein [Methanimicrococcus sp. Es2]WNY28858.1 hypothetical protein MmiEs2_10660 [Methanimicrococcus sp. Es2]